MRRISIWITVVLAAALLGLGYWLNSTGQTAKPGDNGDHQPGVVEPGVVESGVVESGQPTPAPSTVKGGTRNNETDKPGEAK